jgi:organic hydroperoxide reductase OsmC/OhrA
MKQHHYKLTLSWTGNKGQGTNGYKSYERSHEILIDGKATIAGSSDLSFLGDETKHNPEELLLASISSCHMLWYLHLCSDAGIVVTHYTDHATGTMVETANGGGRFETVVLHPSVTIDNGALIDKAHALHSRANELCFIANSVNFKIEHKPSIIVA